MMSGYFNDVKVDQLAIDVVDHFHLRWRPHEVQSGPARENLDVALMRRKARNDVISKATLAADPGNDGCCHMWIALFGIVRIRPAYR